MVIFLAGNIGTGKTSLARSLSRHLGIPNYEVDRAKKEIVDAEPALRWNVERCIPFPDEARERMFRRAVEQMKELARMSSHLIVDETLHRRGTRDILFDAAVRYFGSYMVVLVEADETHVRERLSGIHREEHVLSDPLGMYLSIREGFEPLDRVDILFENNGGLEEATTRLARLIREKLVTHA